MKSTQEAGLVQAWKGAMPGSDSMGGPFKVFPFSESREEHPQGRLPEGREVQSCSSQIEFDASL